MTQVTLGVRAFKDGCLFVLFLNKICVSQGCLVTGCIVGSPWPLSVLRGSIKWKSNREQAGMTVSRGHQLLFLPNPKETDSIMLLEGKDHSFLSAFFFLLISSKHQEKVTERRARLWN